MEIDSELQKLEPGFKPESLVPVEELCGLDKALDILDLPVPSPAACVTTDHHIITYSSWRIIPSPGMHILCARPSV